MRRIILEFAESLSEAVQLSEELFPIYMDRATRLGFRSAEQVVNDNFLVEQNVRIPIKDLMSWFRQNDMNFHASWPRLKPVIAEPISADQIDWTTPQAANLLAKNANSWEAVTHNALELIEAGDINNVTNDLQQAWIVERNLERLLLNKDLQGIRAYVKNCQVFARGYAGLGDAHFIGLKN